MFTKDTDENKFQFKIRVSLANLTLYGVDGDSTWATPSYIKVYASNRAEATTIPLSNPRKKRLPRDDNTALYSKDTNELKTFVSSRKKPSGSQSQAGSPDKAAAGQEEARCYSYVYDIDQEVEIALDFGDIFIRIDVMRERTFASDQ